MSDWLGLSGSRVLVVGAGGIGGACAGGFVEAGARVMVCDRDEARLEQLDAALDLEGRGATCTSDLTRHGACDELVDRTVRALGGIDVLVHAVGVNDRRPVLEYDEEDWDRIVDVNLTVAFRLGQAVGRVMTQQRHGRIVFLSSVSGSLAHRNHAPYAATKGGLNQLMRVMAAEWAASGVGVNAIAPGYVETPLTAEHLAKPGVREQLTALVPAGRLGTPEELVGPVLFLSSDQARFVTGHVLYVDGGRTLV